MLPQDGKPDSLQEMEVVLEYFYYNIPDLIDEDSFALPLLFSQLYGGSPIYIGLFLTK
jgi:hypothetical protein